MSSTLVIVESPAKAKTIEKYLPSGYTVLASKGHVRDLPDNASQLPAKYRKESWAKLGVNPDDGFKAIYVVKDPRSKKAVDELKAALKNADNLLLATDEDREGEAISWHLLELLKPKVPTKRMVFNEITKSAINSALEQTREIDSNLVAAQEARRILDRLVGYPLSLLVGEKIKYGLSAGRVQSAAVRMLVERERERRAFRSGSYWDVKATHAEQGVDFASVLHSVAGKRLATGKDFDEQTGQIPADKDVLLLSEQEAKELEQAMVGASLSIKEITHRQYKTSPKPPFTTSTLQQEASRKLGMSAKQTMSTAQRLYENGFITYMRTDSTNLSGQAIDAARKAALGLYGKEYVPAKPRFYRSKDKAAQEAHEAIRPSGDSFVRPEQSGLSGPERRLYDLIWKRTVACQMSDAKRTSTRFDMVFVHDGKDHMFRANGNRIDFPGYIRAYFEGSDDPEAALEDSESALPELTEGSDVACASVSPLKHETKPPARYTEASLVRALEEAGIGRPSTYAAIMSKITTDERYAEKQGRTLVPTYMAFAVTHLLESYFPELVKREFTAKMENDLDAIAAGSESKAGYLDRFYNQKGAFADKIVRYKQEIEPDSARVIDLENLPGATVKVGQYGAYVQMQVDDELKSVDVPKGVAPADLTIEELRAALAKREAGPQQLGEHPETGKMIYLMEGPYGPYIQLGEKTEEEKKPKRASLPKGTTPEEVDHAFALQLLSLPRVIGQHPETKEDILAGLGPYGPYLKHQKDYRNFKEFDRLFAISLEEALVVFSQPKKGRGGAATLKEIGEHPTEGKQISLMEGRYGPYLKMGRVNASLPKGEDVESLTIERAAELLEEKLDGVEVEKAQACEEEKPRRRKSLPPKRSPRPRRNLRRRKNPQRRRLRQRNPRPKSLQRKNPQRRNPQPKSERAASESCLLKRTEGRTVRHFDVARCGPSVRTGPCFRCS